jgi:hypothetical protein
MTFRKFAIYAASAALMLVITALLLNLASFLYLRFNIGVNIYNAESYSEYKQRKVLMHSSALHAPPTITHPFFGKLELGNIVFENNMSLEPLFSKVDKSDSTTDITVLILGGSFAMHTSAEGIFAKQLNAFFNTDKFSVYNAAFGGGKQPSQYFKLVYLDLLGFKPDVVINIDGFNEIVLPLLENYVLKNPAIFPRVYSAHVDSASNYARSCVKRSDDLVTEGSTFPLNALLIDLYANNCRQNIEKFDLPWWSDLVRTGDFNDYVRQSVLIWKASSNGIYKFTKDRGIDYLHVLQPNQYYENSKLFSEYEKSNTLGFTHIAGTIRRFYPLLSGDRLEEDNFYDQRMIFQTDGRTLYSDNCCHLNHDGYKLIVDDIVRKFDPIFRARLTKAEGADRGAHTDIRQSR